ncbi:MAG: helix-hairpin-helix domain-containing protein [Bacteroides stercoris]
MSELRTIPNIGACTEQDLILMGYTTIASLRGKSAEELYAEECRLRGCTLDRCQLYLYRAVEYFCKYRESRSDEVQVVVLER